MEKGLGLLHLKIGRAAGIAPWILTATVLVLGITINGASELGADPAWGHWNRDHFVTRRAIVADRVIQQLTAHVPLPDRSVIVLMSSDGTKDWWDENFRSSLADGAALRIGLRAPDLRVVFAEMGDAPPVLQSRNYVALYLYDIDGTLRFVRDATLTPEMDDGTQNTSSDS
jgi:hypothetical protein